MSTIAQLRLVSRPSDQVVGDIPRVPYSRFDIRLLDAVAQGCDLASVARRLRLRYGVTRRHLDRLDRSAGIRLTMRTQHTAQLTSAGLRTLTAGRRFYARVDRALRANLHGHGADALKAPQVLAIATSNPVIEDLVEDVAAELQLLLAVSHGTPDQVVLQLDAYRVDAVHTWWFGDPRAGIDRTTKVHSVLDEPLWVWLPRTHPLADRHVVALTELTEQRWVSELGPGSDVAVSTVFRTAGLPVPAELQVTSPSVARGMLRTGEVVGLGSPLSSVLSDSAVVCRPVAERPMRTTGLLVDPTVVPDTVAEHLARSIAHRYLRLAALRHAATLAYPWWSVWYRKQADRLAAPVRSTQATVETGAHELDIDEFQVLRAIAKHGSINRAAAVLSISQPALTRRVDRLERRLDMQLLQRTSRGTSLTGPVRKFLEQLTALETEFHEACITPPRLSDPMRRYA